MTREIEALHARMSRVHARMLLVRRACERGARGPWLCMAAREEPKAQPCRTATASISTFTGAISPAMTVERAGATSGAKRRA